MRPSKIRARSPSQGFLLPTLLSCQRQETVKPGLLRVASSSPAPPAASVNATIQGTSMLSCHMAFTSNNASEVPDLSTVGAAELRQGRLITQHVQIHPCEWRARLHTYGMDHNLV